MAQNFSDAVKEYYEAKTEYLSLLKTAFENEKAAEASNTTGAAADSASKVGYGATAVSQSNDAMAKFPNIEMPTVEPMDPAKVSEMIAEMRSSIEKGNNKQTKDLLARFDRGMGFQTSSSKSR